MTMDLTHDDVQRILKLVDEAEHVDELDLVYGDLQLHVRRHGASDRPLASTAAAAPAAAVASAAAAPAAPPASSPAAASVGKAKPAATPVPEGMVTIRAPMLGTFYRAPAPGEKPFVEVGQQVKASDTVCLIEVMKLFNSINAGVDGTIAQIVADNAALVEYNQVLIVIEPARK